MTSQEHKVDPYSIRPEKRHTPEEQHRRDVKMGYSLFGMAAIAIVGGLVLIFATRGTNHVKLGVVFLSVSLVYVAGAIGVPRIRRK